MTPPPSESNENQVRRIAVVGGGPAGLRAAEVAAAGGAQVTVFESQRSVGRKFLIAGKSGLNLTHAKGLEEGLEHYGGREFPTELWRSILANFDSNAVREWALGLGVPTFVTGSGKVLPKAVNGRMRSTPLLRSWLKRLNELGVQFKTGHRWTDLGPGIELVFESGAVQVSESFDACVLALGGGSWPRTGSDGSWTAILKKAGVEVTPLGPANCGWEVHWPDGVLATAEGMPLKNLEVHVGEASCKGELVITRYGLEGGPLYRLGPLLRSLESPEIRIDFKPSKSLDELVARLGPVKNHFVREARRRWKLDPGTGALLKHLKGRGPWTCAEEIAREVKGCRLKLIRPRPMTESISSFGGVAWSQLDQGLMLKQLPGMHIAGEMLDWEAPTGGYLLQGCFATGTWAGRAALA
ncbi:MAG: putative flavoprotein (TIGR03862 family) [Candidatus Paceibacteria bacterium]|jgi:uncharacterized flavoprotein (TIGR03862 family)